MATYSDQALVIRGYPLGEADRILVLFTRARGKVRAVAKGIRRTKSKFGGRLEVGSVVNVSFYEGRSLDVITQAERIKLFRNIRSDLNLYRTAAVMLEVLDRFTTDQHSDPHVYKLALRALEELDISGNRVVVAGFVAKLMVSEGVGPQVDQCVMCGSNDRLVGFSHADGGVTCGDCRKGQPLDSRVLRCLQLAFAGRVRQMLDETDPELGPPIEAFMMNLVEAHSESGLRTRAVVL